MQPTQTWEHKRQTKIIFDPKDSTNTERIVVKKRRRVAAYARVSTDLDTQQNSYETQIEYYTSYIQSKTEWVFVGVYADEGITGTNYRRREGFNKMITDAMAGKIDLILTKSISRFARNTVDALTVTRKLKAEGIEVFFEKENISSMDAKAEMVFTIMSSIAQEESRSISENVRWGIQRNMEAGKVVVPWKSFLGYERGDDGLPHIVEEEAAVVRMIYHEYLNGRTLQGIARLLIAKHIKTPCSKTRWTAESVRHILTNEKYKGDAVLQKTYTVDFLTKEIKTNNGERKQWYIRDSHDAIITPEAYKIAQIELKRRAKQHGKYYNNPFTSKILCGDCGDVFVHREVYDDGKCLRKDVWMCNYGIRHGLCCKTPMLSESQMRKSCTGVINRVLSEHKWSKDECLKLIAEQMKVTSSGDTTATRLEAVRTWCDSLPDGVPSLKRFDEHAWHTLVEYVKVTPDGTLAFRLRDGRKEILPPKLSLVDIGIPPLLSTPKSLSTLPNSTPTASPMTSPASPHFSSVKPNPPSSKAVTKPATSGAPPTKTTVVAASALPVRLGAQSLTTPTPRCPVAMITMEQTPMAGIITGMLPLPNPVLTL